MHSLCRFYRLIGYGIVFIHFTSMSPCKKRAQIVAFGIWSRCTCVVQIKKDDHLFSVFDAFRAALQITNSYGDLFIGSFKDVPEFANFFW